MYLNEYQLKAKEFACYENPVYPFLALAEEAGEVCGKVAKIYRGDKAMDKAYKEAVAKELGDTLWQLSACCNELELSLGDVAAQNLIKLTSRKEKGTIKGNGDDR
jgi:NTP pyrophosphatase (non-canonical NTP hydrolase)